MYNFKEDFINNILYFNTENVIKKQVSSDVTISPSYNSLVSYANALFGNFSAITDIGFVKRIVTTETDASVGMFNSIDQTIKLFSRAISKTSLRNITEYYKNTYKYSKICKSLLNENIPFINKISELSNNSLTYIDIFNSCNTKNSTSFSIGNFIVLPFAIDNTLVYKNQAIITAYTNETLLSDNLSSITSLPLDLPILVKYQSDSELSTNVVSVQCAISEFQTNLIYIKTYGDVISINMRLLYQNSIIYNDSVDNSEAIFNFNTLTIDGIIFDITISNYNLKKPVSVEISDINILSGIKFSRSGIFETNNVPMKHYFDINSIKLNAINNSKSSSTDIDIYSAVSFENTESKEFFKVDKITGTTFPLVKFTYTDMLRMNTSAISDLNKILISSSYGSSNTKVEATLYKANLENIENIRYKNAKLFIGIPTTYGVSSAVQKESNSMYENWTKIDNFYRTFILNNEDNVTVDIGTNQIKINNRIETGIINIPIGISMIDVHQSLFDVTMSGAVSFENASTALDTDNFIFTDNLYPNNFIYKLAGLPLYDTNGNIEETSIISDRSITGLTIIDIGSPILPYSVSVESSISYKQHLAKTPSKPGTFTVDPVFGTIKIYAWNENDRVVITYLKASSLIKPCGLLFNRLGSYIDFKAISNMMSTLGTFDDTFFSFVIDDNDISSILIPSVTFKSPLNGDIDSDVSRAYYYKLTYNTYTDDNIYVAMKLNLKTDDSELTPIVSNTFIEGVK